MRTNPALPPADAPPADAPPADAPPADAPPRPPSGDPLERSVRLHAVGLWRYLRLLGASEHQAEDLAQEAFLIAVRKGLGDRDDREVGAFLRRTARHLYLRQATRDRRRAVLLAVAARTFWQRHAAHDGGEAALGALRACIGRLTGRARRVVELVYEHGCGRAEAGRVLGLGTNGVKSLLQRVRHTLRACLEREMS